MPDLQPPEILCIYDLQMPDLIIIRSITPDDPDETHPYSSLNNQQHVDTYP